MGVTGGCTCDFHPHVVHVLRGLVSFEADESGLVPGDRVVISQISNPRQGMAAFRCLFFKGYSMRSIVSWTVRNMPAMNTLVIAVLLLGAYCFSAMR